MKIRYTTIRIGNYFVEEMAKLGWDRADIETSDAPTHYQACGFFSSEIEEKKFIADSKEVEEKFIKQLPFEPPPYRILPRMGDIDTLYRKMTKKQKKLSSHFSKWVVTDDDFGINVLHTNRFDSPMAANASNCISVVELFMTYSDAYNYAALLRRKK